jgi:hypothetical protein
VDWVLARARVTDVPTTFEQLMAPPPDARLTRRAEARIAPAVAVSCAARCRSPNGRTAVRR